VNKFYNKNRDDLRKHIQSFPPEYIAKKNAEQLEENEKMFTEFKDAYSKGCCSLCGNKLDYFHPAETCFHWFLKPNGIKKKDFKDYLKEPLGFFRLESYFRWMATLDKFLKNINDLSGDISYSKIREVTIKYKNLEWALNFGQTDLEGHIGSKNADFPHFHLQMLVDGQPFIRFNDFHIPFSDADLFDLRLMEEANDLIDFQHSQGPGMSFIEDEEFLKELDEFSKVPENLENATFNTQSMIVMPDGKTMSGDMLSKIFEESRITKTPVRHLVRKYFPDAKILTQIEPTDDTPEMKKRNKR
jgi:hypothetical protein